jgi:hypothetical protein
MLENYLNFVAIVMKDLMNKMFVVDNYLMLLTKNK